MNLTPQKKEKKSLHWMHKGVSLLPIPTHVGWKKCSEKY